MFNKETITNNTTTNKARQLGKLDYRLEAVKIAMDLLKNAGKKRFKKEFFYEMKEISDNICIYLEEGKIIDEMEKNLIIGADFTLDKEVEQK